MTDDAVAARLFVLCEKVGRAGKGDLRDILLDFFLRHAEAVVLDGQRFSVLIDGNFNAEFTVKGGSLANIRQLFILRNRVDTVRNDFAEKNIFVLIEPFFDDGHHVFAGYANITLFRHINTSL